MQTIYISSCALTDRASTTFVQNVISAVQETVRRTDVVDVMYSEVIAQVRRAFYSVS